MNSLGESPRPAEACTPPKVVSPPAVSPKDMSSPKSNANSSLQQYCLRWNNYQTNLTKVFDQLLQNEFFVDVTLTTEGKLVKCHKVVLSACSPYFQTLLEENPSHHPIVILRDIAWSDLQHIVQYMYKGEISVSEEELPSVLKAAEALKVRGLIDIGSRKDLGIGKFHDMEITQRCSGGELPLLVEIEAEGEPFKRKRHCSSNEPRNTSKPSSASPIEEEKSKVTSSKGTLVPRPQSALMKYPPASPTSPSLQRPPTSSTFGNLKTSSSNFGMTSSTLAPSSAAINNNKSNNMLLDDLSDVKPGIMELIQEEQRAKLLEASQITQNWMQNQTSGNNSNNNNNNNNNTGSNSRGSPVPGSSNCYQYQLQNMWQKCWNQNAALFGGNGNANNTNAAALRYHPYRERGPMKSWRPETMAEAIWSVLQEGLSLSQAARKHDIPYPTFVLYANRVHNMLGPSVNDGSPTVGELRPKGRGRPQRILLGNWPEEHVKQVIRAVVFRDGTIPQYAAPSPNLLGPSGSHSMEQLASQGRRSPPLIRPPSIDGNPLSGLPGLDPLLGEGLPGSFEAQFKQFYNSHLQQFVASAASTAMAADLDRRRGSLEQRNRFEDAEELEEEEDMEDESEGRLKIDERGAQLTITPSNLSVSNGKASKRDLGESIFKLRERSLMLQKQHQDVSNSSDEPVPALALNPEVILTEVTKRQQQSPNHVSSSSVNPRITSSGNADVGQGKQEEEQTSSWNLSNKASTNSSSTNFNGIGSAKTFDKLEKSSITTVDP